MSIFCACQSRHSSQKQVHFKNQNLFLKIVGDIKLFVSGSKNEGLYKLALKTVQPQNNIWVNTQYFQNLFQTYHDRVGQQHKRHVEATIEQELGIKVRLDSELGKGCIFSKSQRLKMILENE